MAVPQHHLFTLPIGPVTTPRNKYPGGQLVATEAGTPGSRIYVLTFTSPPDNRLTTPVCEAIMRALDIIEFELPVGVVVTTSGIAKFYSNGLDLDHAISVPGYWGNTLYKMWARLLTYPMPTIAFINGHAFAGALMTAMHHDYRIFNPTRGFLCVNELDFGAVLKPPMAGIFRLKAISPHVYRDMILETRRFPGPAALEAGLVDALGGMEDVLRFVAERKLIDRGRTGVYGTIKQEMWQAQVERLINHDAAEGGFVARSKMGELWAMEAKRWIEWWKQNGGGIKQGGGAVADQRGVKSKL